MNSNREERKSDEAAFWNAEVTHQKGFRRHFYTVVNDYLWNQMMRQVGDLRNRRVLFIGCGTSSVITREMAERGAEVWCVDISPDSIDQLMKHPFGALRSRIHPVVADAEDMPFEDGFFDVVLGKAIVHHLDINRFINELERVCVPGALIVFSEPMGTNPFINMFRWLTPKSRVPTEHPLMPADVKDIQKHCGTLHRCYNFLFSIASFPWFFMGFHRVGRLAFAIGCALDRVVFALCPPARWLAWNITLSARLQKKG